VSTTTRTKTESTTFKLYHGAGEIWEIPGERVAGVRGSTLDALRKIASEHIRDPELIRTLNDSGLVIQSFSSDPDDVHQQTVSPQADFSTIAERLLQESVEMSASVRHQGG